MPGGRHERYESSGAQILRRDWSRTLRPITRVLAAGLLFAAVLFHGQALPAMAFAAALLFTFERRAASRAPAFGPGIVVDEKGVSAAGRLVVRRSSIQQGFLLFHGSWRVRLEVGRGVPPWDIDVHDEDEGRELLRTLGFDVTQSTAEITAHSPFRSLKTVTASVVALTALATLAKHVGWAATGSSALLTWIVGPAFVLWVALAMPPMRVLVGLDGVVTRFLGFERRYPFSEIERVRLYDVSVRRDDGRMHTRTAGVELLLSSRKIVRIAVGDARTSAGEAALLRDRIDQALAAFLQGESNEAANLDILARGSRAYDGWIASLRTLGSGESAGFRSAAVPRERLMRVALDASAPSVVRASAAVALAPALDGDERTRIRDAASSTVSPKLRIAIERAISGDRDDAALAEALAELEAENEAAKAAPNEKRA